MSNQDDKAIFITGRSSGLGRATSKLFASKGWEGHRLHTAGWECD
jgi:NADP-dependent 3-hydroxy acid dehydrogenase YdfG